MIPQILFTFIAAEAASFCSTDSDSSNSYHLGRVYSSSPSADDVSIERHWPDSPEEADGDTCSSSDSDVSPREKRRQLAEINAMFPIDDYHPMALVQAGLPYTNIPRRKPLCIMPTIQEEISVINDVDVDAPRKRWWMCFSF